MKGEQIMNAENDNLTELIKESFSVDSIPEIPEGVNQKILKRIEKEYFWINLLNDFGVKLLSIIAILIIPPIAILSLKITDIRGIIIYIQDNIIILSGGAVILIAILFMNEFIDQILIRKKLRKV